MKTNKERFTFQINISKDETGPCKVEASRRLAKDVLDNYILIEDFELKWHDTYQIATGLGLSYNSDHRRADTDAVYLKTPVYMPPYQVTIMNPDHVINLVSTTDGPTETSTPQ